MFFSDFDNDLLLRQLSGNRLTVLYRLTGDENTAYSKAKDICTEQTVEFPDSLLPEGAIADQIVGKIEDFRNEKENSFLAAVSYAEEDAAGEFTQFLNVVFGNISIKRGIQVAGLVPGKNLLKIFPGPKFGIGGLRKILEIPQRPPLFTAVKPMGLSAAGLAKLTAQFAEGGIDIIKDDHGLSNQVFAPFEERVKRCAEAVGEANVRFNRKAVYVPNISAPFEELFDRVHRAKELGAGGVMISPGLTGFDTLRALAAAETGLPIIAHPTFLGSYVMDHSQGISSGVLFGTLMRLAGADATIFPNYGGRFPLTPDDCLEIVNACRSEQEDMPKIFPCPAGGMELKNIPDMLRHYGKDILILIGSGLFRLGNDLIANIRQFRELIAKE
ncbi:MAG: hypothetical protein LBH00_07815 [Planctomycetaceae bacterium]|jgi:ribulose-bisphosphate carboxylase large chain|nr:hypothetical protein [Planctomycetaceae bacterium]